MPRRSTDHVVLGRFVRFGVKKDDLEQNHDHLEYDREETGSKMGKVRKLVVIYIGSDLCSTTQLHCIHHVAVLTTWS